MLIFTHFEVKPNEVFTFCGSGHDNLKSGDIVRLTLEPEYKNVSYGYAVIEDLLNDNQYSPKRVLIEL